MLSRKHYTLLPDILLAFRNFASHALDSLRLASRELLMLCLNVDCVISALRGNGFTYLKAEHTRGARRHLHFCEAPHHGVLLLPILMESAMISGTSIVSFH